MNKKNILFAPIIFSLILALGVGCAKDNGPFNAPTGSLFLSTSGTYAIIAPTAIYKVPVGLTAPSQSSVTVDISVSSPTGATEGTHYSLSTKKLTFAAGEVTDTIIVTAKFSEYQTGRKDTIFFNLTDDAGTTVLSNQSFRLRIAGPCYDTDIADEKAAGLLGSYPNSVEIFGSSTYNETYEIAEIVPINATSAKAVVKGLYGYAAMKAEVLLDWSVLGDYKITVLPDINTTYTSGGNTIYSGPVTSGPTGGSFTYCNNKLRIPFRLYTSGGTIDEWIVEMSK